jgi:hypothetical protein
VDAELFERVVGAHKTALSVTDDHALGAEELAHVVEEFKGVIRRETGEEFPQDPFEQLYRAIRAPSSADRGSIWSACRRPSTMTFRVPTTPSASTPPSVWRRRPSTAFTPPPSLRA